MNSTKTIIICLAILMTLFFIGLSLNLINKDDQGLENRTPEQQNKAASGFNQDSWMKSIDSLLAPFSDSLTSNNLVINNCKVGKGIILNKSISTCSIKIKGFSKPSFKKLSLKPRSNSKTVKLKITYKETGGKFGEPSYWPSKDTSDSSINFVIIGNKELHGKIAATIVLQCLNNCNNHDQIKITFE